MIVVSDTTPLRHLIAIGEAELLPKLYGTVIVPGAVWAELQAEATIQLASELGADLLLMEDREGRLFALRRQLPVTGTLGVPERADVVGLLSDLPSTLARLEASGFYLSTRLRESVLARHRNRQGIGS
jgi:hypothetical protein